MSSLDFAGGFALFWPLSNFAFRLGFYFYWQLCRLKRLLFLTLPFAKAPILATVLSGLPSWVWIALAHNRLPWVAQLLSISLSFLWQSSCVEDTHVKQLTLSFYLSLSLSLSLSLPTIGCHGLPSCYLSLPNVTAIANNFGHKLPALMLIQS